MKNYFVAARRLTIPVLIGVGSASWIDSWSIVGLAECGTTMGICILFIYVIPNTILRLPLALWIGPLVRDKMPDWVITMPDLMQYMYSKNTKLVMALGMLCTLLYESALLTAGGQVISYVTRNKYVGSFCNIRYNNRNLYVSFGNVRTGRYRYGSVRHHVRCSRCSLLRNVHAF